MDKVTIKLPFVKETPGALRYGVPGSQRNDVLISDIYVRKDLLREAGHQGDWPLALDVSVEIAE